MIKIFFCGRPGEDFFVTRIFRNKSIIFLAWSLNYLCYRKSLEASDVWKTVFASFDQNTSCIQYFMLFLKSPQCGGLKQWIQKKDKSWIPGTPGNIYLLKVNHRNTWKRCETCSKLIIKTPERRHWRRPGVLIVNFEHISHLFSSVSIDFEQVNVSWTGEI